MESIERNVQKVISFFMKGAFYQLIFLGDVSSEACASVRRRFFELLKERGLDSSLVSVLDGALVMAAPGAGGYESYRPSFAFYFGKEGHGDKDVAAVEKLMANGDAIFPICHNRDRFSEEMPEVLHTVNGRAYNDEDLDSIVNVALEELRLLRKVRRVFISYKRSDSAAVANQLYDVLSRHQFDVFLDTYSIRGAADFQAELHHRITDCDVLVQLNSPHFKDSGWCNEEISEANALRVGVLQINWPGVTSGDADYLSAVRQLSDFDFRRMQWKKSSSILKTKVLGEIASKVEEIRARNIAARQDNLTGEFVKEANRQGRTIIKEPTFLVEQRANGDFWYFIPAIGVPKSDDCHESVKMLERWNGKLPAYAYLIYDDLSILPRWIDHLEWLNQYLEVKTIQKRNFASWLKETK